MAATIWSEGKKAAMLFTKTMMAAGEFICLIPEFFACLQSDAESAGTCRKKGQGKGTFLVRQLACKVFGFWLGIAYLYIGKKHGGISDTAGKKYPHRCPKIPPNVNDA
jgi:hypothetical protein